jgi:hypothetical protein
MYVAGDTYPGLQPSNHQHPRRTQLQSTPRNVRSVRDIQGIITKPVGHPRVVVHGGANRWRQGIIHANVQIGVSGNDTKGHTQIMARRHINHVVLVRSVPRESKLNHAMLQRDQRISENDTQPGDSRCNDHTHGEQHSQVCKRNCVERVDITPNADVQQTIVAVRWLASFEENGVRDSPKMT